MRAKHLAFTTVIAISALAISALATAGPGDRRPLSEVSLNAVLAETQASAEPTDGFNLVWWIPHEYWRIVIEQDASIPNEEVDALDDALGDFIIVGIVRADISDFGTFSYHSRAEVLANAEFRHTPENGRPAQLAVRDRWNNDAQMVLDGFRPILTAAMGNLGENFHFFLIENRDERISPYKSGKLIVNLDDHRDEQGGEIAFQTLLDSLHVPRLCPRCQRETRVTWKFCPWDATPLSDQ